MQGTQQEQNDKIAHYWACRYLWAVRDRNDIDIEDLQQAAFLGILQAKKAYKEDKGGYVALAGFYARKEIRSLLGIRNGKLPPAMESLDEPLNNETDDTRLDLLADETLPEADAALLEEEKRQTVRDAVNRLKDDQKTVVTLRYFEDKTGPQAASIMQITPVLLNSILLSAKTNLRRDRLLQALVDRSTQYMYHVGVAQFNTTMTSAVEELVMLREHLIELASRTLEKEIEN